MKENGECLAVAFSPDDKQLAIGLSDGPIVFVDVATGHRLWEMPGHRGGTGAACFAACGSFLVSGGGDQCIRIWESPTGRLARVINGAELGGTIYPSVCPGGKTVAAASTSGIIMWDVTTGKKLRQCEGVSLEGKVRPRRVAFSPDGKTLAAGGSGIWDVSTGKKLRGLDGNAVGDGAVAFSPDGKLLATGGLPLTLCLYDVSTGREIYPWAGHRHRIKSVAFSGDGRLMATGAFEDKTIILWDPVTGRELRRFACNQYWFEKLAFSVDDSVLAIQDIDGHIRLYEVATGSELSQTRKTEEGLAGVAFAPDGEIVSLRKAGTELRLVDAATGRETQGLKPHHRWLSNSFALSPHRRLVASSAEGGIVELWDLHAGKGLRRLSGHMGDIHALAFSPCAKYLASASVDGSVLLWDLSTHRHVRRFVPHQRFPLCIAFAPDGRTLASGDDEGVVRLWELATGKERCRFQGGWGGVSCLAFSQDGRKLASESGGKTVLVWDLTLSGNGTVAGPVEVSNADLGQLLSELASADARRAYRSLCEMVRAGERTTIFLRDQARPSTAPDPKQLNRLIAQLDDDQFANREHAEKQLAELAELAELPLQKALAANRSTEFRRRAERLLERLEAPFSRPDQLRAVRTVELLEKIDTSEARTVLKSLARGAPAALLTREAKQALDRLNSLPARN